MKIRKEKIHDFAVLYINGRIDTVNSTTLEAELEQLQAVGEKKIILECQDLNYISSSGLRVFLNAQKKALSSKGKLLLCDMQLPIREIFDISGFSSIFSIYHTLEEALGSEQQ